MDFVNNMKDKLSQAGQTTLQKAKDLSEITKLNSTISSTERQILDLYSKIGYEVYVAYKDAPLKEVEALINQVNELNGKIDDCKNQINAINAADLCPNCGAKVMKGKQFCSACGAKLDVQHDANGSGGFCPECGAQLAPGSVFCPSCGAKVG